MPSLLILPGCIHQFRSPSFMGLSINMSKDQVIDKLGKPDVVRGSIVNNFDQTIEVWEYVIDRGKDSRQITAEVLLTVCTIGLLGPLFLFTHGQMEAYWLYFNNNILAQWGRAGDWATEANHIQEVRFR